MVGLMHLSPLSGIIESHPGGMTGLLVATACVVPALAAAYLSFSLYESRLLRLKKYFRYDFPESLREECVAC